MRTRRRFLTTVAAASGIVAARSSFAQNFPSKPITLVVPFPPGGPTDQMARVLGELLTERLGQPVVVDNKPGGGGQVAVPLLMRAPADGHTLLIGEMSILGTNAVLYKKFSYDPPKDFAPIASMLSMPMMVLAPRNSSINTLQEAIALARSKGLNYGSPGTGTVAHFAGELLKTAAKVDLNHVPYKGSAPAMADLVGGQVDLLVDGLGPALPLIRDGKIKALAIATPTRAPLLPNLPTTIEAGYPSVQMSAVFGIVARSGTPAPIVQKLYEEIAASLKQPKFAKRFEELGFEPVTMNPEQYREYIGKETDRQGALIRAANITVD